MGYSAPKRPRQDETFILAYTCEKGKLIQAELERLPDQDWTEVFKKAGCDDLKNAPAGRPLRKKKKT